MKRTKISFLLVLLMSLTSIQVKAGYDVALQNNDGKTIYYWWDDALNRKEVWVCDPPSTGGYSGNIVIPASITYENITYPVTRIYAYAFQGCTSLNSVTIPNSVTSIGYMAFEGCSSLNSVSIGNSVTSIESAAFENCTSLTSVTIPTSVTSIGYHAFYGTGWYNNQSNGILYLDNWLIGYKGAIPTDIEIVEGTKGIAGRAFWSSSLTSVTIPNSVKRIGEEAFASCI